MVQFAPAAKVAGLVGQALAPVLVAANWREAANELFVKAAVPVFVSVTVIGVLVVASGWLPKPRLVGANPTPGAVPFPLSVMICGLPPALSDSDSVPARAPEAVGAKVTLMVQFAPAAKVAGLVGQALAPVLVAAISSNDAADSEIYALSLHDALPIFIGVLVVASGWLPKPRLVGANPTPGAVPFPLSVMICGLPPALSASDSVPFRAPTADGVKVTLIVQCPPPAKVAGLVGQALAPVLVAAKSPEAANELIVKAAFFFNDTATAEIYPLSLHGALPISRLVGANPTPGAVPFPLSVMICGLPPALSVSDSVPVRAPEAVGVKVTLMVQVPPAPKITRLNSSHGSTAHVASRLIEAENELILKASAPVFFSFFFFNDPATTGIYSLSLHDALPIPTPGAVPFPLRENICGLPPASSASDSVPVRAPEAVGVKVTLMVQVPPAAKVAGLVGQALAPVLVAAKSPEAANELIVKAAAPVFVSVTVIGALVVASSWLPKSRPVGANPTPGEFEPVPLRLTFCGLFKSSSEKTSVAASAAATDGVKVTLTLH